MKNLKTLFFIILAVIIIGKGVAYINKQTEQTKQDYLACLEEYTQWNCESRYYK